MPADEPPTSRSTDEILRARARDLARTPGTETAELRPSIVLDIGDRGRIALPLDRVRSVSAPGLVAPIPQAGHQLVGARLVGGEVIALADLGAVLGYPSDSPATGRSVVVIESAAALGVLADRVSTAHVDRGSDVGDKSFDRLVGSVTTEGVLVVDVDAVLADARFAVASAEADVTSWSPATEGST